MKPSALAYFSGCAAAGRVGTVLTYREVSRTVTVEIQELLVWTEEMLGLLFFLLPFFFGGGGPRCTVVSTIKDDVLASVF